MKFLSRQGGTIAVGWRIDQKEKAFGATGFANERIPVKTSPVEAAILGADIDRGALRYAAETEHVVEFSGVIAREKYVMMGEIKA